MHKGWRISIFILGSFLVIAFLIAMGHLTSRYYEENEISKVPEMTLEKAQRLFEEVGGTDVVNREANVLLTRCITEERDFQILYPEDLRDTPSIALLFSRLEKYSGIEYTGTGLIFYRNGECHYLLIKFGNHFMHRRIYIFGTDSETTMNLSKPWIEVAPNIFIEN